jgi:hypothetical protein
LTVETAFELAFFLPSLYNGISHPMEPPITAVAIAARKLLIVTSKKKTRKPNPLIGANRGKYHDLAAWVLDSNRAG